MCILIRLYLSANCLSAKCLVGEMSALSAKCPGCWRDVCRQNVLVPSLSWISQSIDRGSFCDYINCVTTNFVLEQVKCDVKEPSRGRSDGIFRKVFVVK